MLYWVTCVNLDIQLYKVKIAMWPFLPVKVPYWPHLLMNRDRHNAFLISFCHSQNSLCCDKSTCSNAPVTKSQLASSCNTSEERLKGEKIIYTSETKRTFKDMNILQAFQTYGFLPMVQRTVMTDTNGEICFATFPKFSSPKEIFFF